MAKTPSRNTPTRTAAAVKPEPAAAAAAPAKAVKTRPAVKKAATESAAAPTEDKTAKAKKPKLVRDSFTMPKTEYAAIDELKQRAIKLGRPVKKSELLRAGIMALSALDEPALTAALTKVPAIKTGRPKQATA